jgi:hypothetical protein
MKNWVVEADSDVDAERPRVGHYDGGHGTPHVGAGETL